MRRLITFMVLAVALLLAGCGTTHHAKPHAPPVPACVVPVNHGSPGACAPASILAAARAPHLGALLGARRGIQIVDLSNNDPIYDMRPLARFGIKGMWLKVNEGTGFSDNTFSPMVRSARAARIPVGGYDFVRTYSASEAYLFVGRLKATGTCTGRNTLPPVLDIEANRATQGGVQTMVNIVRRACRRVAIYTGLWYWLPTLGPWWPSGVSSWVSGYPNIVGSANYGRVDVHQFTDRGYNGVSSVDLSTWEGSASGYAAYVRSTPVHHPHSRGFLRRRDQAHLHRDYLERRTLRGYIRRFGCHTHPHRGHCAAHLARGAAVNREIRLLRARGAR